MGNRQSIHAIAIQFSKRNVAACELKLLKEVQRTVTRHDAEPSHGLMVYGIVAFISLE